MQQLTATAIVLKDLLEVCRDGEHGFMTAASEVTDASLKAEFIQYSVQRKAFADELVSSIDPHGESNHESGSFTATLHRGWMELKAAISSHDTLSILSECERGEDAGMTAYREAIQVPSLEPSVIHLISAQYDQIQRVHDRIKLLREAYEKPVSK